MRLAIHTLGTRGDVQPYIALARGLMAAGCEVVLATAARFEGFVAASGVPFAPLPDDFLDLMDTPEGRAALSGRNTLTWTLRLARQVRPMMRRLLEAQWAAVGGADAIIYHPKALGSVHIAERLGIPALCAFTLPGMTPTRAFPSPMLPFADLGPLNRLSHELFLRFANSLFREPVNRWREEVLGLPPSRRDDCIRGVPVPRLYGFSKSVVPEPIDWDGNSVVTGYWFLDDESWLPSPSLQGFLQAGPPPVYVGFGSVPSVDPVRTTAMILEALALAGQRGILSSGWGGLAAAPQSEHVYMLDAAPHDRLFPHVRAVVHHGGAGTTAAGLRAGRPTVICPFFGDQPFWGRRVADLGVGPAPIAFRHLTVARLVEAITSVVDDDAMQLRAERLGAELRTENGVGSAVAFILEHLATYARGAA
ncbi:glycosyltransferase [Microvirga guangxiensis]|uniref:UDP:flavonoid glycosyltransferase YjiC, YdhE family n=1 Tax=Microvirga guangxiensis TaxID=549386 RepID=A0A1G5JX69_9HYPH|nr:glycosyltransferase [Microvirga guangxiensis]SCY92973.1 UDP:flavonoid glycosyltransferase YjiC, YdhE family [Microvirga guangxiensis]